MNVMVTLHFIECNGFYTVMNVIMNAMIVLHFYEYNYERNSRFTLF